MHRPARTVRRVRHVQAFFTRAAANAATKSRTRSPPSSGISGRAFEAPSSRLIHAIQDRMLRPIQNEFGPNPARGPVTWKKPWVAPLTGSRPAIGSTSQLMVPW